MLTTPYAQFSAMHTMSNEVVTRLATEHDESGQSSYHEAKLNYQLTMNRFASHLPPTWPPVCSIGDIFETYCSSRPSSPSATMGMSHREETLEETIDRLLYSRALRRREDDVAKEPTWKRGVEGAVAGFLRREGLARQDVEDVQREFRTEIITAFDKHPFKKILLLTHAERQARKAIQDAWMSESLPFMKALHMTQVDFMETLWRRAFGRGARATRVPKEDVDDWKVPLDSRLYVPLLHHCNVIRSETESEECIAFLYIMLGQSTQRDLITSGVMTRNKENGLIDSTQHPIYFQHYEAVDLAFGAESRYLVESEETMRMAIVDEALTEKGALCKEFFPIKRTKSIGK